MALAKEFKDPFPDGVALRNSCTEIETKDPFHRIQNTPGFWSDRLPLGTVCS